VKRFLPAIGFFGGFAWDAVTLGRSITSLDLFLLLLYYAGAALILFLLGRGITFRFSEYLNFVLQFFIGGIFSALVVFYFLSSSSVPGLVVVGLLVALLVGNEFLERRYSLLALSWTMFAVAGVMFFNFALPHLFRSISSYWFYLSTVLAIAAVALLRQLSKEKWVSLTPAMVAAGVLLLLHATNVIPPVPLVQKRMVVAHEVKRTADGYRLQVERPGLSRVRWLTGPDIHLQAGSNRLYCFTSVFVPPGIETTIRHRWDHLDEKSGEWKSWSTVSFPIRGGRSAGYRGYSYKSNLVPGRWRVVAESETGATIGVVRFRVVSPGSARLRTVRM
jgi:hypothetical protein